MDNEYIEELWDSIPGDGYYTPGSDFYDTCEEIGLKDWDE